MNTKALLNKTSKKKRNGMLTFSNTDGAGNSATITQKPLYVNAPNGAQILWCATAMDLSDQTGSIGTTAEQAQRTSTVCYMRGLSEHIRIQTSSGIPWFWRRICFTYKGNDFNFTASGDTPINGIQPFLDTPTGIQRYVLNQQVNTQANTIAAQQGKIFKGASGVDWNDPIIAPVDTNRVTLKYDKTQILRSGNANGTIRESKLWHPMSHNLNYDDDEAGSLELTNYFSTDAKAGMGDYYVYDVIRAGIGGTASDLLYMNFNSTLYWHEK